MLRLDAAGIGHGEARRLDAVSLALRPGELVAVVGPNGAGKSTLLKALAGHLPLDRGSATLDDTPLARLPRKTLARRRAVLSQHTRVSFAFRVYDVVMFGRSPHLGGRESARDHRIVGDILARMDLAHLAERPCNALSGGEQQRVHIARTIAQLGEVGEPRYALLDEPTSSLDIRHQHAVLANLAEQRQHDVGLLAVVHELNLAARYADRVAVVDRGRLVAIGTPAEVLRQDLLEAVFKASFRVTACTESNRPEILSGPPATGMPGLSRPATLASLSNNPQQCLSGGNPT